MAKKYRDAAPATLALLQDRCAQLAADLTLAESKLHAMQDVTSLRTAGTAPAFEIFTPVMTLPALCSASTMGMQCCIDRNAFAIPDAGSGHVCFSAKRAGALPLEYDMTSCCAARSHEACGAAGGPVQQHAAGGRGQPGAGAARLHHRRGERGLRPQPGAFLIPTTS